MITVDMPALQQSIARWNSYIAGKIDMLQVNGQGVVKIEAGRLVQTLIKVTPPEDRSKTSESIEGRVTGTFHVLGEGGHRDFDSASSGGKAGSGDVRWYAFTPGEIYGVARDKDMSGASAEDLYAVYFASRKLTTDGRVNAGSRGKQTVYLWQKITTKAAAVRKLAARLKKHVGRLKAAWLVAWNDLGKPGGTYAPPQWVTQHESGARGYSINGLGDPRYPQFTLENHAKGAGSGKMAGLAKTAMDIRTNAMVKRMTFLIAHPEKVAEEVA